MGGLWANVHDTTTLEWVDADRGLVRKVQPRRAKYWRAQLRKPGGARLFARRLSANRRSVRFNVWQRHRSSAVAHRWASPP
jgi:hypothetical protein